MTIEDPIHDDGNAADPHLPLGDPRRPPPAPVFAGCGYPNYGFNTRNPPTNLWGPSGGANIAAMATSGGIPDNVVITNNCGDSSGSWASTVSTAASTHQSAVAIHAIPSNPNAINGHPFAAPTSTVQKPLQQQQTQQSLLQQQLQPPSQTIQPNQNRAIHRINLSSIRHNYAEVQSSAAHQQCQVIVVVKADGYGHGAILTACHLVERCGASAFAVATLEEGITLRRAFEERFPSSPRARILVLGAPVGYPNCFDAYLHNNIELMVSGPEVAASLSQWMTNHDGRRRAEVERVAERRKEELMDEAVLGDYRNPMRNGVVRQISKGAGRKNEEVLNGERDQLQISKNDGKEISTCNTAISSCGENSEEDREAPIAGNNSNNANDNNPRPVSPSKLQRKYNAATLTNVTGDDLAREVRQILVGQRHATAKAALAAAEGSAMATIPEPPAEECGNDRAIRATGAGGVKAEKQRVETNAMTNPAAAPVPPAKKSEGGSFFCGIEDAARASRQRELRVARLSQGDEFDGAAETAGGNVADGQELPQMRKKLRWHALVDSGMGRLGFKTQSEEPCPQQTHIERKELDLSDSSRSSGSDHSGMRDTVSIIKELYDAEVHEGAPIEFYGMCTHMADANSTSTYTNDQMGRFRTLLHRVRSAGIAVPSISTDNSAALLTTSLTHFDPNAILAHDTRGYVRCGGAIYGQRPAFRQLRAVSTLSATVKHVAIIKQGESVGYDRAYVAPLDVRIATLTVGFADGYPRELGNGVGKVSIRGSVFPVAGNVCMDMLMVDLGPADDAAGSGSGVAVGDTAVLWGPDETRVEEHGDGLVPLAELAGTLKTTQSALTCGLDKLRVQRQLVG